MKGDIEMAIIYYRSERNVVDLRIFKDTDEFWNWISFATKYEPITILGIYDKNATYSGMHKDYAKFVKKYRTGQIVND